MTSFDDVIDTLLQISEKIEGGQDRLAPIHDQLCEIVDRMGYVAKEIEVSHQFLISAMGGAEPEKIESAKSFLKASSITLFTALNLLHSVKGFNKSVESHLVSAKGEIDEYIERIR